MRQIAGTAFRCIATICGWTFYVLFKSCHNVFLSTVAFGWMVILHSGCGLLLSCYRSDNRCRYAFSLQLRHSAPMSELIALPVE